MQRIFPLCLILFFFHSNYLFASYEDVTRSLIVSKSSKSINGQVPELKYLQTDCPVRDPATFQSYETALVTYFSLLISEKGYFISAEHKQALAGLNKFPIVRSDDYVRLSRFSENMNSWLPAKERPLLGYLHSTFSYFWPTINFYDELAKIRKNNPLGADYIAYLFNDNSKKIEDLAVEAHKNCAGVVSAEELLTLFAMHTFGIGEKMNLNLAHEEAAKLGNVKSAKLILSIVREYVAHLKMIKEEEELFFRDENSPDDLFFETDLEDEVLF